jgi:hypothetical protein
MVGIGIGIGDEGEGSRGWGREGLNYVRFGISTGWTRLSSTLSYLTAKSSST